MLGDNTFAGKIDTFQVGYHPAYQISLETLFENRKDFLNLGK